MAKKYLATYDDINIFSETRLQLKSKPANKHINDCALGDIIKLPETKNGTRSLCEYIVVEKNNDYVIVLRKYVDTSSYFNDYDHRNYVYDGNSETYTVPPDAFCKTTMYNRYSSALHDYLYSIPLLVRVNSSTTRTISRSIFIPSSYNLFGEMDAEKNTNDTIWFTSNDDRKVYLESNHSSSVKYWTRTFADSGSTYKYFITVQSSGAKTSNQYSSSAYYRPAVSLAANTPLNSNNEFEDTVVYTNALDTVSFGNDNYRLKDIDGRVSSNITYDNTTSGLTATNIKAAIDEVSSTAGGKLSAPSSPSDGQILKYSSSGSAWVAASPAGGFVAQSSAPSDTSVLWVDTDDNTIDESLANADTSSY